MTNSLAALIAGVKVKPMVWDAPVRVGAKLEHMTTCRTYKVVEWNDGSGHVLWFGFAGAPIRIDADSAAVGADVLKAFAQADYEARILAALEAALPADVAGVVEKAGEVEANLRNEGTIATRTEAADTIRALIALAAAQAAQIAGLTKEPAQPSLFDDGGV